MSFDNRAFPHREGRTLMLLPQLPENAQGPSVKSSGVVFYNPAMAGSRTRSVLLFGMRWKRACSVMVQFTLSMGLPPRVSEQGDG